MAHVGRGTSLLSLALLVARGVSGQTAVQDKVKVSQDFGRVPLYEENRGETDARHVARTNNLVAFLTPDGWTLSVHGEAVSMRIANANRKASFTAGDKVQGISDYYLGSRAITRLTHYASVRVTDILPGIDIVYRENERELEYDLVIRPEADPDALRLRFEGGNRPVPAGNGHLLFETKSGELRQRKPRVWQEAGGQRREVECRYALSGPGEVRLVLENYNRSAELAIDPDLSYSTYLGGTGAAHPPADAATGIAVDCRILPGLRVYRP